MAFNIDFHPTLNFLVGNLVIATLAQAPSPPSNAFNPCLFHESKSFYARLYKLSLPLIYFTLPVQAVNMHFNWISTSIYS